MHKFFLFSTLTATIAMSGIACAAPTPPTQGRTDLALGKKVLFSPVPNYGLTKKGNTDATDLTDGKLTQRADQKIWFESSSVGWGYAGRVNLAVDLGQQSDIDEIAMRFVTVANSLRTFPGWVEAFVSDDGAHYTKVAEFSRWNKDEFKKFGISQAGGDSQVEALRFTNLNARGRWVGLRFYGNSGTHSDELYVFGKPTTSDNKKTVGTPSDFTVQEPQVYFHKPYLELANNVELPVPIGIIIPNDKIADVTFKMDLPPGLEIASGSIKGVDATELTPKVLSDGWRQYQFDAKDVSSNKVFGRLYMRATDWKDGQDGKIRYQFGDSKWQSPQMELPVHAVNVPAVPRLKKIMASMGWWPSASYQASWQTQMDAFRTIGLNTFNVFGWWIIRNDDKTQQDQAWKALENARQEKFFIANIDSPIGRMKDRHKNEKEIYDQFKDGSVGSRICISYRGKYYQEEIERYAQTLAKVKPDFSSDDIELWSWRGPVDSKKCLRCQEDFKKSGAASWDEWQKMKGQEIRHDLVSAARKAVQEAGGKSFDTGMYDVRPGKTYQNVWDYNTLYPNLLNESQVSTYTSLQPSDLELIGDEVREDRAQLSRSDVMPWITPGDAGTFPGRDFQSALLEAYANGSRGVWFWSSRVWDAEDLIAYNKVIRAIAPVEDVITEGNLIGNAAKVTGQGRVSGMKYQNRMMLLVADYFGKADGTVKVLLDVPVKSTLRDLSSGQIINANVPAGKQTLSISLNGEPNRLVEIVPE